MTWHPVKPTVGVATEAYQTLLELRRQHPNDPHLENELECARHLMHEVWEEHDQRRRFL